MALLYASSLEPRSRPNMYAVKNVSQLKSMYPAPKKSQSRVTGVTSPTSGVYTVSHASTLWTPSYTSARSAYCWRYLATSVRCADRTVSLISPSCSLEPVDTPTQSPTWKRVTSPPRPSSSSVGTPCSSDIRDSHQSLGRAPVSGLDTGAATKAWTEGNPALVRTIFEVSAMTDTFPVRLQSSAGVTTRRALSVRKAEARPGSELAAGRAWRQASNRRLLSSTALLTVKLTPLQTTFTSVYVLPCQECGPARTSPNASNESPGAFACTCTLSKTTPEAFTRCMLRPTP
mmetsp:Transcript_21175/g.40317  ORF Transcript_21175/g.40317 Transcript_21175/m.40317 type:complete len:288 (-) Transcript_21175:87-950(-)